MTRIAGRVGQPVNGPGVAIDGVVTRTSSDMERIPMLVLSRRAGEEIVIGDSIRITVASVHGDKVRIGISAPEDVPVHRSEVFDRIREFAVSAALVTARPIPNLTRGD